MKKEQIEEGIRRCMKKVNSVLDDVEILCNNNGNESTAVSIYTVAIEEYGKALLLKKCLEAQGDKDGNYEVSKTIFGIRVGNNHTHTKKFEEAIHDLPEECLAYQKIDVVHESDKLLPKQKEQAEKLAKVMQEFSKEHVNVEVGASITTPFDFEVRKNLLYVDWDDENKIWRSTVEIEQYRYKKTRRQGYVYDEKLGLYMKKQGNTVTATTYPYDIEEIELSEEEIYPEILLNAIENFRTHIQEKQFNFSNKSSLVP